MNTTITSQPTDHISLGTLMSEVSGPVLTPTDEGYATELGGFNLIAAPAADLVVGATNAHDVALAVRYARANGFRVGARATGHGLPIEGRGTVVVTTSRLNSITVDPVARTARVGAGVRWRDVVAATTPHGLTGVVGSSSSVGVVGYTLGGGLSPLGRRFGWAADHVRSIELVTADGVVRSVDASAGSDLFWAILGGRDGFGIVTAIEFELFDHPPSTAAASSSPVRRHGTCCTRGASGRRPFRRRRAPRSPPSASHRIPICPRPCRDSSPSTSGTRTPETPPRRPPFSRRCVRPGRSCWRTSTSCRPPPWTRCTWTRPARCPASNAASCSASSRPRPSRRCSRWPDRRCRARRPSSRCGCWGGRLRRPQRVPNAVAGRHGAYSVIAIGVPARPLADQVGPRLQAVLDALAPWRCGALLNFCGLRAADRAGLWGPDERLRLETIRRRHDPAGVLASR
ncbi:putative oxidoreductase [Gordonia paraffinivorans NBRC 108238]|uniref:Oxidoreductase n=1 Tax=Gordonia paraffinivorans NBRC 108238 TaxID=1223543 RepID=A0ABQ0IIR4_9ACTN|nr:FAD-binding oxidoreductase [Gordonia paraffinivorans]GAC83464.1 putative oxidoreductase [Gordonia paraffinivorans NBRC 108238]